MIIDDLTGLQAEFLKIIADHRKIIGPDVICVCGAVDYDEHFETLMYNAILEHVVKENDAEETHAQED